MRSGFAAIALLCAFAAAGLSPAAPGLSLYWREVAHACGVSATTQEQIASECAPRAITGGDEQKAKGDLAKARQAYTLAIELEKSAGSLADPQVTATATARLNELNGVPAAPAATTQQAPVSPVPSGPIVPAQALVLPQYQNEWDQFAKQYCHGYYVGSVAMTARTCANVMMDSGWEAQQRGDLQHAAADYSWAIPLNTVAIQQSKPDFAWGDPNITTIAQGRLKTIQELSSGQAQPADNPPICAADMHHDLKSMNLCSEALWPLAEQARAGGQKEQAVELYKRVKAIEDGLGMQSKNPGRGWDAQSKIGDIATGAVPRFHPTTPPPPGHYFCYSAVRAAYSPDHTVSLVAPTLVGDFVLYSGGRYLMGGKNGTFTYKDGQLINVTGPFGTTWNKMEYFEDHKHPSTIVVTVQTASAGCELRAN